MAVPAALVAAMMRDPGVRACVAGSGQSAARVLVYLRRRFVSRATSPRRPRKRPPAVFLALGDRNIAELDNRTWSGTLPASGTYALDVFGPEDARDDVLTPYAIRLEIR